MMNKISKEQQIIAISRRNDGHINFVQPHLDREIVLIDPKAVQENTELTYDVTEGSSTVTYDGIELSEVGSVWYRKPETIEEGDMPSQVAERYRPYGAAALNKHAELLYADFPDAVWISDVYAIKRAANKTIQYREAAKLGFKVPETTLTSSSERAKRFVEEHRDSVVKTLSPVYCYDENDKPKVFLTRRVNPSTNFDNLHLAPAIFQERIDGTYIRATVVGDEVFAALEIVDDELQERYGPEVSDSRIGQVEGRPNLEPFDTFPDSAKTRCIALTKRLGLKFGAIDLIMDNLGEVWFLEINPNGQWGYVEKTTGQQIGKAVAELLVKRDK